MAEGEKIELDDFNTSRDNKGFDDDDEKSPFLGGDKMMPPIAKTSTHRIPIFKPPFDQVKDISKPKPPFYLTDKMQARETFKEINREEVKKYYPRMSNSIEVDQIDGSLSIRLFGGEHWKKFRTKDKRERVFKKELRDALGPTAKEVRNELREEVKKYYPEISDSIEVDKINDKLKIRLSSEKKWSDLKTKTREINKKLSNKIKNSLGPTVEEAIVKNQETVDKNQETIDNNIETIDNNIETIDLNKSKVVELDEEINSDGLAPERKEELIQQKDELEEINAELEETNVELEETNIELEEKNSESKEKNGQLEDKLPLRDRVRLIFKKHGFTAISIISAVGVIIGVIISNLTAGLSKMTKGVGNGLKDIGEKLGAILPGMIGAIASFIFKTAGEVVGFLAKNAWLLIIAVVVAVVDRFKKKNK